MSYNFQSISNAFYMLYNKSSLFYIDSKFIQTQFKNQDFLTSQTLKFLPIL